MKSILIIDDDKTLCRSLVIHLELAGYPARSAFTGEDGLFMTRYWQPNLILLDINLPDQSGFSVLKQIIKQFPLIQVIMMSACSYLEFEEDNVYPGETSFMRKPIDFNRLYREWL